MNVIELHHIDKAFGDHKVLEDFHLEVEENSFVAIAGPSGCGKSTLLNLIGLLDKPDNGSITLFDKENLKPNSRSVHSLLKNRIGYLFQNFALIDEQSVSYNLDIALEGVRKKEREERKRIALQQVQLPESILKKKVYQCSGGEQQRISIARILLKKCDLILADEPTGSLDEGNKKQVYELLRNLQKMGKTIVMVTHDEELMQLSDTVITLEKLQEE